jgi:hypothetical protein
MIKQLSVFIENKEGRIEKVTETINKNNINILSISLADTSEYGMLRMIVSDPQKGRDVLKESGFSVKLVDVLAVKLPHKIGMLHKLLKVLVDAEISVEYMYVLDTGKLPSMILKVSNAELALSALLNSEYEVLSEEEAYNIML